MFMTDQQATELSQPRVGAFDDLAPFVVTQRGWCPHCHVCQRPASDFVRSGLAQTLKGLRLPAPS